MAVQLGIKTGYLLLEDDKLFDRIADGIAQDHPDIDRAQAGRILGQAILFVAAAGKNPGMRLSPSPAVDIGVDAFILHTEAYAAFCDRIAGRYVHHTPIDKSGNEEELPNGGRVLTVAETAEVMRRCGYWVLEDLWPTDGAFGPCYCGTHEGDGESGTTPPR